VATQQETYKGFVIKADAVPVVGGFALFATISGDTPRATEFPVAPPARLFPTADVALDEAKARCRLLIDELQ